MKTIRKYILGALALTLGLTSCGDFLDVKPRDIITLENFWNEKSDIESVIAGCYTLMAEEEITARMMIWGEFRSENVNIADETKDPSLTLALKEGINATNWYTNWRAFYNVINRCNTAIYYANEVASKDPSYTVSEVSAHIAEATAIRSLMYWYLIRTFRNVPYTEEAFLDDTQEFAIPVSSFDDVLAKLIASLEAVKDNAVSSYPEVSDENSLKNYYNTGRITRWAIYAMLADMYLWQQNYDKCIEYSQAIIDYKREKIKEDKNYNLSDFDKFGGYPIIPTRSRENTYGNAFTQIFIRGNSIESIFELNYTKTGNAENSPSNVPASNFYGNRDRSAFVTYSSYVGLDESQETYRVYDSKNKGLDARGYENFFSNWTPAMVRKFTASYPGPVQITFTTASVDNITRGILTSLPYSTGKNYASFNKSNWIIYRLTDVMLMQAEAYALKIAETEGNVTSDVDKNYLQKAFTLVNAVNKRSVMQYPLKDTLTTDNIKTKRAITDLVYQERHRELMFEGKRYYDLVRRSLRENPTSSVTNEYLRSQVKNKSTALENTINTRFALEDALFWPYFNDEVKINPYLKAAQNPAYSSGETE
jgi:hypothetical protein